MNLKIKTLQQVYSSIPLLTDDFEKKLSVLMYYCGFYFSYIT